MSYSVHMSYSQTYILSSSPSASMSAIVGVSCAITPSTYPAGRVPLLGGRKEMPASLIPIHFAPDAKQQASRVTSTVANKVANKRIRT